MHLRAGATDGKTAIKATTELGAGPMLGVPVERGAEFWPALIGATLSGLWAGVMLTEPGWSWLERALPFMHKSIDQLSFNWPMRLAVFGVGLALIVVFVVVANRNGRAVGSGEGSAPETVVPVVTLVPALKAAEPPDWVGEVTPVISHAAGSLELYGDEGYSDLLMVDNISPLKVRKLEGIGIRSRGDLLRVGRSQLGRQDIARRTGIGVRQLTDWINKADLLRIDGPPALNMAHIRLLEVAGIETIADLAVARPEAIHRKLIEFSKRQGPNLHLPTLEVVAVWVDQAGKLS